MSKIKIYILMVIILALVMTIIELLGLECKTGACKNPFELTVIDEDMDNKDLSGGGLQMSSDEIIKGLKID